MSNRKIRCVAITSKEASLHDHYLQHVSELVALLTEFFFVENRADDITFSMLSMICKHQILLEKEGKTISDGMGSQNAPVVLTTDAGMLT